MIIIKFIKTVGATFTTLALLTTFSVGSVAMAQSNLDSVDVNKDFKSNIKFKDINGHWAHSAIERAIKDELVKGYNDGTFKPNGLVTKAEFASVIVRATGMETSGNQKQVFSDVPKTHWAYNVISQAVELGFINPSDYGVKLNPNAPMTRIEMAKWLGRGLAMSHDSYNNAISDLKNTVLPFTEFYRGGISKAQIPYVGLVLGTGVISGFPDGSFGGTKNTTRAEMVAMTYRYLAAEGKDASKYEALNELREVGKYGTNMVSLADAVWGRDYGKEDAPFYDVVGKPIAMKYGMGTVVIDKYILVDLKRSSVSEMPRGVYAPMAGGKDALRAPDYGVLAKLKVKPTKNITNVSSFIGAVQYVTGNRVPNSISVKFNLPTTPNDFVPGKEYTSIEQFFKSGVTRDIWIFKVIDRGSFKSIDAVDKTMGTFKLK